MKVIVLSISIYTIGWFILIVIAIAISSLFYYLYAKDSDKRKLMFAFALFPSTISFLMCAMGINKIEINYILTNLYYWGPFPIIMATFIAVNESIIKGYEFDKMFKIFIGFFFITFAIGFLPITPTSAYTIMYIVFSFEIILVGLISFFKTHDLSIMMFILAIICFIIAGSSLRTAHTDLSIFGYIIAYIFFGLVIDVSKSALKTNGSKLGSYFSLEKRLEDAELALKDGNRKYNAFFNHSLSWVFIQDFQGNLLEVNEVALRSLGLNKDKLNGLNISKLLKPEDLSRAQEIMKDIIETGHQKKPAQYELKDSKGNLLWLEVEGSLIYKDGKPYAIQGIGRDITEQKITENELKNSEEKFRFIAENSPDLIYQHDVDGKIIYCSPAVENIMGIKVEELIGTNFAEFVSDDQKIRALNYIEKVIKYGYKGSLELKVTSKNGNTIWFEMSTRVIEKENMIIGIQGVARNITDRKQYELEINEWKNRYEAAVKASKHLLYDWNCHTNEVKYGGNIENILGYSAEDMIGGLTKWVELIHPDDRDIFQNTVKTMVENAVSKEFEYRVQKKDGQYITVEDTGQFITDDSGNITSMIGFIKDISRHKQAAEAIKKKNVYLERFTKLAIGREKKIIELKKQLKELEK